MTSVTLVRTIEAPPDAVFAAFVVPEKIALWWGPDDGPVLSAEVDARAGGRFHIRFRVEDGSEHGSSGVFDVFEPHRRLAMSWTWDDETGPPSRLEVTFRAVPAGTEITLVHARLDEKKAPDHETGWSGALDKLQARARELVVTRDVVLDSPTFETRADQPYVGKRVVMPMSDFETRVPALMQEVSAWLEAHGMKPAGPGFLRYHVVDMPTRMDVEASVPVDAVPEPDDAVTRGTLPAGRYASLVFTGVKNGIEANARLIAWLRAQNAEMDVHHTDDGDMFAGRLETLLTDPRTEPDQSQWRTEVAIKVRGE